MWICSTQRTCITSTSLKAHTCKSLRMPKLARWKGGRRSVRTTRIVRNEWVVRV